MPKNCKPPTPEGPVQQGKPASRESAEEPKRSETEDLSGATASISEESRTRWRVCLHEAGHAVAARRLLHCTAKAMIYEDGFGAAYYGNGCIPKTFDDVLAIAAGPAAESLFEQFAPPTFAPAPPVQVTYPEAGSELRAQLRESVPDAKAIARWCIAGIEKQPERWVNRYYWIGREASLLVVRYAQEIVETATGLFAHGIITLPAEPAQKGTEPC